MENNLTNTSTYKFLRYFHFKERILSISAISIKFQHNANSIGVSSKNLYQKLIPIFVVVGLLVLVWIIDTDDTFNHDDPISWYINMYQSHCRILLLFSVFICHNGYQNTIVDMWNKSFIIDGKINQLDVPISYKFLYWNIFYLCVNYASLIYLSILYNLPKQPLLIYFHYTIYLVSSAYKITFAFMFQSWIILLSNHFKCLNEYLKKNVITSNLNTLSEIEQKLSTSEIFYISEIYMELTSLTDLLNNIYSLPLLFNVTYDFSKLIIAFYRTLALFFVEPAYFVYLQMINTCNIVTCIFNIITLTIICDRLSKEVSTHFYFVFNSYVH